MKSLIAFLLGIVLVGLTPLKANPAQKKQPVRIYLESFRNADQQQLTVRVLTKKDRRYRPAAGLEVYLYLEDASPANLLGTVKTSAKGTGTYTFTTEQFARVQGLPQVKYLALVNENDSLQGRTRAITIKDVQLEMQFAIGEDSTKQIFARVWETDSAGNMVPQKKVKIKFLVDRPLSPLPVGDEYYTTDAQGRATAVFPDDLPGDANGNVKIMVRIAEHDDYGTVEVSAIKPWGIPTIIDDATTKRSLWASGANAPIPLLIFINSLILSAWGIIFYIIYEVFRIKKLGNNTSVP